MKKIVDILLGILSYVIFYYLTGGFVSLFIKMLGGPRSLTDYGIVFRAFFLVLILIVGICAVIYFVSKKSQTNEYTKRTLSILFYAMASSVFVDIILSTLSSY